MTIRTVAEALASLRQTHAGLLDDLARGDRVLWVGSGVSRDQVPGLEPLLRKVLTFLQTRDTGDPGDPHRKALEEILREYLPAEVDPYYDDPAGWTVPSDLSDLVTSYSEVLSTEVDGEDPDYLLWTAVDIRETYGSPAIEPGSEHWLISFLMLEGAVSEVVTANWDGLIERAMECATASNFPSPLALLMSNESFRMARGRFNLYKPHGCAVLARESEENRKYLVAQTADITSWLNNPIYTAMVEKLRTLARTRKSLMLGLSVQDFNLMVQIAGAGQDLAWPWEPSSPAYVFAEIALQQHQRQVLRTVYQDDYQPNRTAIASVSAAGMYSGLLLAAATLHVLIEKFRISVEHAPAFSGSADVIDSLCNGLERIESHIADDAAGEPDRLVAMLRQGISSLVCRYFNPAKKLADDEYMPFCNNSLKAGVDDQFRQLDLPPLAVTLGLLGLGYDRGHWQLAIGPGDSHEDGVVQLTPTHASGNSPSTVVITRDWRSTDALMGTELWISDPGNVVVVQATGARVKPMTRGVGGGLGSGRSSKRTRRQIWLSELESHAGSGDTLLGAFRAEVSA